MEGIYIYIYIEEKKTETARMGYIGFRVGRVLYRRYMGYYCYY